ncbi:hypothetical protein V6N13_051496 [Hibiscus sabdariffa]|uniref:Uncharacterized protein n=1 Tax=Hibiscus sabdariffa TaxID=183260 RepID=A0ABR2T4B0_9ROSI
MVVLFEHGLMDFDVSHQPNTNYVYLTSQSVYTEFVERKSGAKALKMAMASSWKAMSRLTSRLHSSTLKLNKSSLNALHSTSNSSVTRISSVGSMMPLHNAIASARLISSLASESQTWSLVPQVWTLEMELSGEMAKRKLSNQFGRP